MYIPQDTDMLYSMINMKLRDQYDTLEDLCECEEIDLAMLLVRMNAHGYEYDEEHNKFSPIPEPVQDKEDEESVTSLE